MRWLIRHVAARWRIAAGSALVVALAVFLVAAGPPVRGGKKRPAKGEVELYAEVTLKGYVSSLWGPPAITYP